MAVTTASTVDVSQVIATALAGIDGLRVEWYVADKARPPCAIVALPRITFNDPESTFCWARWDYSIAIVTARNNDLDAQKELSRLVRDVAVALDQPAPEGVFDIQLVDANPSTTAISGVELPSYIVRVAVRA